MNKQKKRNNTIDMLRGLSILVMIYIHTSTWYASEHPFMHWSWDLTHFAVSAFVFCSAYLFFLKDSVPASAREFISYLGKRIKRLVIPFYIFFAVLLIFMFFLQPDAISWKYFYKTVFLLGGRDESWLVLLFIYLMILLPIVGYFFHRVRWAFIMYGCIAVLSAGIFLFFPYEGSYRFIMWLPWSVIVYFAWVFVRGPKKPIFYTILAFVFSGLFLSLSFYFLSVDETTVLTKHKYPPDLLYLSYGMLIITILFALLERFPIKKGVVERSVQFFSLYSYSIFFIHTIVIYVLNRVVGAENIPFMLYFGIVLVTTVLLQNIFNRISSYWKVLLKSFE